MYGSKTANENIEKAITMYIYINQTSDCSFMHFENHTSCSHVYLHKTIETCLPTNR